MQEQRSENPRATEDERDNDDEEREARGEGEEEEGGGGRRGDNGPGLGPARVSSAGFDQWSLFFSKKKNLFQFCDIENFAKFSQKKTKEEEKLVEFTLENTPKNNVQLFWRKNSKIIWKKHTGFNP